MGCTGRERLGREQRGPPGPSGAAAGGQFHPHGDLSEAAGTGGRYPGLALWAGACIATQLCTNLAAVLVFAVFCGNTGFVLGHGAFMAIGAYLSGILTMPAGIPRTSLTDLPAVLSGHELSIGKALPLVALTRLVFGTRSGGAIAHLMGTCAAIASLGFPRVLSRT